MLLFLSCGDQGTNKKPGNDIQSLQWIGYIVDGYYMPGTEIRIDNPALKIQYYLSGKAPSYYLYNDTLVDTIMLGFLSYECDYIEIRFEGFDYYPDDIGEDASALIRFSRIDRPDTMGFFILSKDFSRYVWQSK